MQSFSVKTLVDITVTNPTRDETDPIKIAQQGNFNSLLQGIGMRANMFYDFDPIETEEDGTKYWLWNFKIEQPDIWKTGSDPLGLLKDDLNGIPIIGTLTNTIDIKPAIFDTKTDKQNIWISPARL